MSFTRRSAILGSLSAATITGLPLTGVLGGCAAARPATGTTRLHVLGAIHSTHRKSTKYSLGVLREAVRRSQPDVVITEIPPDRIAAAKQGFAQTGKVTEPRTKVFPEYTDVVFPLSAELGFDIVAGAGWTSEIASNRGKDLKRIENDPARADQWAQHLAARRRYSAELAGRGDDPKFIHTQEYDAIVERAQTPYQRYFDADLGPGGWTQINRAHTDLIQVALDNIKGQGLNALVTFGSWHKYMILRALASRSDVELLDAQQLFD